MSIVLSFSALAPLLYWFFLFPTWAYRQSLDNPGMLLVFLGQTLFVYPLIFPIALFWHFWDFIQKPGRTPHVMRIISNYRVFLAALVGLSVMWVLGISDVFTTNSCETMPDVMHHECVLDTPLSISLLLVILVLLAILLGLAKAANSISSLRS